MSVTDALLAYTFAATLLTLTPGLDTALILRTAAADGGKKAVQAALGIQLLLRPRTTFDTQDNSKARASNSFLRGMLGNVLNPKMGVFYVSFLPQFIPAGHSPILWTFLLVSIHALIGTLWSLTLIVATRYASGVLKKPGVVKWMDRVTGGVFLLFAVKLALSKR
ncbi:LysE family translocator [Cronobacter dublinensis]